MSIVTDVDERARAIADKRRRNAAKARQALAAKKDEQRSYSKALEDALASQGFPEPPTGVGTDHPMYRAMWHSLIKSGLKDDEVARWILSNPKLIEEAEREAAIEQRKLTEVPVYLQDHPAPIAIALEQIDSSLSTIAYRRDNGLPMSDLESAIASWVGARTVGHDPAGGATLRAVLAALIAQCEDQAAREDSASSKTPNNTLIHNVHNPLTQGEHRDGDGATGGGENTVVPPDDGASGDEVREENPPSISPPASSPTPKKIAKKNRK